jgi:hypothetical protein
VLFSSTQPVHPASSMHERQSQQAWIISQHLSSPLVHVRQTPFLVISQRHSPMVKLQQQTIMPFIIMQQLHMPPDKSVHRFCTMLHASLSSQEQVIFMPPVHFSIWKVQRGTMSQFMPAGILADCPTPGVAMPGATIPDIPIPVRSLIIALDMCDTPV